MKYYFRIKNKNNHDIRKFNTNTYCTMFLKYEKIN